MRSHNVRRILALLVLVVAAFGIYFMTDTLNMQLISKCTDCDNRDRQILSSMDYRTLFAESHDQRQFIASNTPHILPAQEKTVSQSTLRLVVENPETDVIPDLWSLPLEFTRPVEKPSEAAPKGLTVASPHEVKVNLMGSNDTQCASFLLGNNSLVRNCITNEVIGRVPVDMRTASFRSPKGISLETAEDRRNSFQKVFGTRAWGHGWDAQHKGLNASGMGATLHWTQEAIAGLHIIINQLKQFYGITRIRLLDIPCGDMAWMSRFLKTRDDIDYTGIDIVSDLIEHHRQAFKGYSWRFDLQDVVAESTIEAYHLILCRTLLQHLYFHDASKLLERISNSGSGFLLVTSFYSHSENVDLVIGDDNPGRFRRINLELKPISLVPPRCMFRDGPPDAFEGWDHFLGLWKLPLRRVRRCKAPAAFELHGTKKKIYSCTNWTLT